MTLTMTAAHREFSGLPAVKTDIPNGRYTARAVAIPGTDRLAETPRRMALLVVNAAASIIYRGKHICDEHGINLWALGYQWAQFAVTHQGRHTYLSYDLPDNPSSVRRLLSELRVDPTGHRLCRLAVRARDGHLRPVLYFTLEPRS